MEGCYQADKREIALEDYKKTVIAISQQTNDNDLNAWCKKTIDSNFTVRIHLHKLDIHGNPFLFQCLEMDDINLFWNVMTRRSTESLRVQQVDELIFRHTSTIDLQKKYNKRASPSISETLIVPAVTRRRIEVKNIYLYTYVYRQRERFHN